MFNSDNLRLDGKCAIITGAGAGIGKEIAITFATAGASVVVSDINADAANHVVDEIQQLGGQAFACRCDITSEQELSALADFAVSKLGKVDILVNNAGGGGPKPFDMPMADFRRAYELNVFSFFHLSQLVAPEMEKNGGGVILTITSMAAENKNINMTSYASSLSLIHISEPTRQVVRYLVCRLLLEKKKKKKRKIQKQKKLRHNK